MKLLILVRLCLLLTLTVIVLGAYTRLADAGLGCPDWPGCYGQLGVPNSAQELANAKTLYPNLTVESEKAWLEMIHRYFAGALGLLVLFISVCCVVQKRMSPTLPVLTVFTIVFQALLGMWTVTMKLMPVVVMGHLLGGFTLLCLMSVIYWRLNANQDIVDHSYVTPMFRLLSVVALITIGLQIALGGWTSSNYAALMCTNLPVCEGDWVSHLDFKHAFQLIQPVQESYEFGTLDYGARMTIHVTHRFGAFVVAVLVSFLVFQSFEQGDREISKAGWWAFAFLVVQIALGISNVLFSLPLPVAVAHNLVAALLLVNVLYINFLVWHPAEA
ncbi:COX15/CtaA family protein [Vibrio sonorensis]|uniref:COX15/CtaA family protein n=1 Tax=Vibrio sonorensis TaxID=1004316 RepID=UPI0008DA052F|nr:COX15/CtaA family protein [Vibrio sonorensis]